MDREEMAEIEAGMLGEFDGKHAAEFDLSMLAQLRDTGWPWIAEMRPECRRALLVYMEKHRNVLESTVPRHPVEQQMRGAFLRGFLLGARFARAFPKPLFVDESAGRE